MSDIQLLDIKGRHGTYVARHNHVGAFDCCSAHASADDVPKLLAEIDRLRANRPPLRNEYGLSIDHLDTTTEERAIADTLGGALEVLAEFDARERPDVVSRKLRVREVGPWRDVEQEGERG